MINFNFKTRGNQSAQGKQKAYFCAHPDDFNKYFEAISEELLDILENENNRNCAFFYLEDPNAERDNDFLFNIKEMNLLIMPVTEKLLTTPNAALEVDFKIATENAVPVLPLLMESGLEDLFNKKCGNLQFLDPNTSDATSISYKEKLTKYLTSIFIGDELVEKIRKAFDAYIFLSYRKKDRQYAQELMRLIHKNDFCRDIAIWYDEFLTPGENFNDSIKEALEKSKLFALTVTPSLLEKTIDPNGNECENYIVTTEYPMAQKAEKHILATELVKTDKTELASKFENIPDCINAKDESVLTDSLLNALKGIALRENDNDPQHNFFIGLAYLSGIDVEKDSERAIELITSAAHAELPEAMEKLVMIYRTGEAGEINYTKAIEWQQKLVFLRRNEAKEHLDKYVDTLWLLGDYTKESKEYDTAGDIFNEMLTASQASDNILSNFRSKRALVSSYTFLGDIKRIRKENIEANEFYNKAHSTALSMTKDVTDENSDLYKKDLAISYERLALICKKEKKWDEAKEYFSKALEFTLQSTCDTPIDWWNKSLAYYEMSEVIWDGEVNKNTKGQRDELKVGESLGYLKLSKECLEELMKKYLDEDTSKERTKTIKRLLDIYTKLAQRNTAAHRIVKRQYNGCVLELTKINLKETVSTFLPNFNNSTLWKAFQNFGYAHFDYTTDIFYKQSELSQKKQDLLMSIDQEYVDDNPLNISPVDEDIYLDLGKTTFALEEYEQAKVWYTKALNCLYSKNTKSLDDMNKFISCYEALGDCFVEENLSASRSFYTKLLAISDYLSEYPSSPELTIIQNRLADVFEKTAHILKDFFKQSSNSLDEALLRREVHNCFFKCLELRKMLSKTWQDDLFMEKLAFAYYNFSKNNISHDNAEINEQLNTAISIWQELLNKYPNDSIYTFLIDCANGKSWDNPFDF